MEVKDLKSGDYITFKYGDSPYFYYVTGKITSLNIPKSLRKKKSIKDLDWKEKLKLNGHVSILLTNSEEMTLCLAQVINGCEYSTNADKEEYNIQVHRNITKLTRQIEKMKRKFNI